MDVPVWHASLKQLEKDGKVAVVAIVQDQHPDRARLFLQWKQIGWPTLADSLDLLNLETVPLTLAVDEYGIVRFSELPMSAAKTIEQTFVNQVYPKPAALPPPEVPVTLIHGTADDSVPVGMSRAFGTGRLAEIRDADHFDLIDPHSRAWPVVLAALSDIPLYPADHRTA